MRRDVFQAIADPTRREILELLTDKPMNLNALAEQFDISRPAISKQVKILTECGLVTVTQDGRERWCVAQTKALEEVTDWVEQFRKHWENRFDNLNHYLKKIQHKK